MGLGKENGIGAAIAFTLAIHGARIVINYVSEATAVYIATVVTKINKVTGKGNVLTVYINISKDINVKSLIKRILKGFKVKQINILSKP
jgi:NAD(P)-dependent dehydrogenase (short-subunit alcohol dehydrogenase family)